MTIEEIKAAYRTVPSKWANASFGIFVPDPKGNQKIFGVGTAFVAQVGRNYYVITAQHVLKETLNKSTDFDLLRY